MRNPLSRPRAALHLPLPSAPDSTLLSTWRADGRRFGQPRPWKQWLLASPARPLLAQRPFSPTDRDPTAGAEEVRKTRRGRDTPGTRGSQQPPQDREATGPATLPAGRRQAGRQAGVVSGERQAGRAQRRAVRLVVGCPLSKGEISSD